MNPSYCRIRVPRDEALPRFAAWNNLPEVGPLQPASFRDAVRLALDQDGRWRGNALFISDLGAWSLFQDLSGGLSAIPAEDWLRFAGSDDLVFAGYNDAIGYGELIVIAGGRVIRAFLDDAQAPGEKVNAGELAPEDEPIASWIDVAEFIESDELAWSEMGWLWVYS